MNQTFWRSWGARRGILTPDSPADLRRATGNQQATLEDAFLYFVRQGKEAAK